MGGGVTIFPRTDKYRQYFLNPRNLGTLWAIYMGASYAQVNAHPRPQDHALRPSSVFFVTRGLCTHAPYILLWVDVRNRSELK